MPASDRRPPPHPDPLRPRGRRGRYAETGIGFGQGPQTVHMVGKDDPGIDMERRAGAHSPHRVAQFVDMRHQQVGAPVKQVHRKAERSTRIPIAAILRHARSMPGLGKRRNALPLFRWGGRPPRHLVP